MKLLKLEAYLGSVNAEAGISEEMETLFIKECKSYIETIVHKFNFSTTTMGISMFLFHLYIKHVPFTEVDRTMLASVCLYLGCKVDYFHLRMSDIMSHYHENKKGPKKRKPFLEVQDQLTNDFSDLELKVLKLVEFDFNFEVPFDYIRVYKDRRILSDDQDSLLNRVKARNHDETLFMKAVVKFYETAKRCAFHSYSMDLCLYFPAPVIAGAVYLIADKAFSEAPFETFESG